MNIIKKLMDDAGITQKQLSIDIGVSQPTVSDWMRNRKNPRGENLQKVADYLGVDRRVLLGIKPLTLESPAPTRIPVLGSIPAGIPLDEIEDIIDWEEIPDSWLHGGKKYFALQVHGSSMYPKYLDGDVIILRQQDTCESGQDCAVRINGEGVTLKRVKLSERGIMLQPLNPDFDPITYSNREITELPVQIVGVVVQIRRDV